MILENHIEVAADPDAVFALLNDVERVAGCLPGATLEGRDGDSYRGRVRFKVGPISAAYAGTVRFSEVAAAQRRLRLVARGADTHGNGDAEADVALVVSRTPAGSALELRTDLSVRGKIAQFGKSAISAVSNRLLEQFARNLAERLRQPDAAEAAADAGDTQGTVTAGVSTVAGTPATSASDAELDGLAMLVPPALRRYGSIAAVVALAFVQGWLLGRMRTQRELIKELRRDR